MPAAARRTDLHTCPMQSPNLPPIPRVGGPIVGPGCPSVLIGGLPAACLGDTCVCVGPFDSIVKGSSSVLIDGKPMIQVHPRRGQRSVSSNAALSVRVASGADALPQHLLYP